MNAENFRTRGDLNVRQHILLVSVREPHNWDPEPLCIQPVLKLNSSGFLWTKGFITNTIYPTRDPREGEAC